MTHPWRNLPLSRSRAQRVRIAICEICKEEKPTEARGMCGLCYGRFRYHARRDHQNARKKAWQKHNPDKVSEYREKGRSTVRRSMYRRVYGWEQHELELLLFLQGGACALCETYLSQLGKLAGQGSVDHCHDSGHVRGILCGRCNKALGMFRESPELLQKASEYARLTHGGS